MKDQNIALRSWILMFCSLTSDEQEKIRLKLDESEVEKLEELLQQVQALGIDSKKISIKDFIEDNLKSWDSYSELLSKVIQYIPPVWYVLLEDNFFTEVSLKKDPAYYKEYMKYKEIFNQFKLAPKMKASLSNYFYEKVIYE
ncbi:hypothetical protein OIN78_16825 [Acinetobacter baumannii]|nr:hypothetical protein [Acinetobacter baumannii]